MLRLVRANCRRMIRHYWYLGGLVLAFGITYLFSGADMEIAVLHNMDHNECMILASGAMFLFFSLFLSYFQDVEYSDGVIRNKVICGYSQAQIFLAHEITSIIAVLGMAACWVVGGLLGGATLDAALMEYIFVCIFANIAYASFVTFVAHKTKRAPFAFGIGLVTFQFCFMTFSFSGFVTVYVEEAFGAVKVVNNILSVNQWLVNSFVGSEELSMGFVWQICASFILATLAVGFGTYRLNKRDIK